jgi:hypothetical protein
MLQLGHAPLKLDVLVIGVAADDVMGGVVGVATDVVVGTGGEGVAFVFDPAELAVSGTSVLRLLLLLSLLFLLLLLLLLAATAAAAAAAAADVRL